MTSLPKDRQNVEVLIEGRWTPAIFFSADSVAPNSPDQDELWWVDYFLLESGDTIPEDIHQYVELPQWRAVA